MGSLLWCRCGAGEQTSVSVGPSKGGAVKNLSLSICSLSALISIAASHSALAQANVAEQCAGVSGKTYACCVRVITANPGIGQCAKEVAVFQCVGNKNSKYVSRNGCVMPKL